jgi:hypothetical protein
MRNLFFGLHKAVIIVTSNISNKNGGVLVMRQETAGV